MSYYSDSMWCKTCKDYVHYLQSTEQSYCVECGSKVQFFKDEDLKRIRKVLGLGPSEKKKRSRAS